MKAKIDLSYRGQTASVELTWTETPFECTPTFSGDPRVLGALVHELQGLRGYFVAPASIFNAEAYLNAAHSASCFFDGFTYTVSPPIDLSAYLTPEDKDPEKVY
jgi:hypothetical protein